MSLNNFIPQLWADTLLVALRNALVFGNLVNRDYEGTISRTGDTVRINGIGQITVSDYVKDTDIAAPQALTDAQTVLTITQAKYYNFEVDDVDAAQQQPKVMQEAMSYAAYQIANTIDTYLAGLYTEVPSANSIGSSGSFTTVQTPLYNQVGGGSTVYDEIVKLGQFLTQNKVPRQGRWCVIPPWCATHLSQDPRFTSFNTAQAQASLQDYSPMGGQNSSQAAGAAGGLSDAFLGRIKNMDVYESNNCVNLGGTEGTSGSQDVVLAGHPMAWTYADGLQKVEAYRPPLRFADAVKGLHLYGSKVTRPYALAAGFLQMP